MFLLNRLLLPLMSPLWTRPKNLNDLAAQLSSAQVIAFDTETTSTEEVQADIVGISLAVKEGHGFYIPVGHLTGRNLPLEQVISILHGPLTNPHIPKVAHNAKYDYIVLVRHGLAVTPITFDTMIAEFLVDPSPTISDSRIWPLRAWAMR